MSSIVVAGDTSGTITLQAPAVAGSTTLNLPPASPNTSANGYCYVLGAVLFQWGTVVANSTAGAVVFSTDTGLNFPNALWSVTTTTNTTGTFASVTVANTTQLAIRTSNATAAAVRWIAIGN